MTIATIPARIELLPQDWDAELTHLSLLHITGEEACKYVQGQVTCNVETLANGAYTFGAHCDFKGKMWSIFLVAKQHDELFMFMHRSAVEKSLAELKKYGVFSKVTITDMTDEYTFVGALPQAHIVQTMGLNLDNQINADSIAIYLPHPVGRYLIAKRNLAHELSSGSHVWEALNIQAGIASVQSVTAGEYVPQMVNLQAIDGAIDFQKGCYMGQEVVARTKYLGKNKRAGAILYTQTVTNIPVGAIIEQQLGENWRRAGQVLTSASLAEENWIFAVLPNDIEAGTPLRIKEQPDVLLQMQELPYDLIE